MKKGMNNDIRDIDWNGVWKDLPLFATDVARMSWSD